MERLCVGHTQFLIIVMESYVTNLCVGHAKVHRVIT